MSQNNLGAVFISVRAGLARAISGIAPPREIEDIVQETYVKACTAAQSCEIRAPRSFLYKIARNLAYDHVKRAESRLTDNIDIDTIVEAYATERADDETFDQVSSHEEFSKFCDSVRDLPVMCRRAFVLKKVYGYSQREIGHELGISESTVEKHIALGIKRCTLFMMKCDRQSSSGEPSRENFGAVTLLRQDSKGRS